MSAPIPQLTDRDLLNKGAVALTFGEAVGLPPALSPKSFYDVGPDSPILGPYDPLTDSVLPSGFEARARQERMSGTDPLSLAEREYRREEERREDRAMASVAYQRYQQALEYLDQRIALTERDLREMREGLAEIEAQRAELAPLIAAQRQVVEAAQQAYDQQKVLETRQEEVVLDQRATVNTLTAQLPAKEQAVETATQNEQVAKAELQASTAEAKVAEAEHQVAKTDADASANQMKAFKDSNLKDAQGDMVFKKTAPDGTVTFVDAGGDALAPEAVTKLRETVGADVEQKAREYNKEEIQKSYYGAYLDNDTAAILESVKESRQEDVQKAQVKWEKADEALTYAQGELNTLNEKISTETEKLKVEEAKLAEIRAKIEERRKTLENEKEKLAEIEAQDKELALKQQEMKDQIKVQENKLSDLKATQDKMKDPEYARKMRSGEISYEQVIQDLPASERAGFMAQYPAPKQQATLLPDTNPAAQRVASTTPAPSSPAAASKPETGITAASALGGGLKDEGKAQVAFNQVAPDTKSSEPAAAPTPATPKPEEEKKLVASAPVPAAPAVA